VPILPAFPHRFSAKLQKETFFLPSLPRSDFCARFFAITPSTFTPPWKLPSLDELPRMKCSPSPLIQILGSFIHTSFCAPLMVSERLVDASDPFFFVAATLEKTALFVFFQSHCRDSNFSFKHFLG